MRTQAQQNFDKHSLAVSSEIEGIPSSEMGEDLKRAGIYSQGHSTPEVRVAMRTRHIQVVVSFYMLLCLKSLRAFLFLTLKQPILFPISKLRVSQHFQSFKYDFGSRILLV